MLRKARRGRARRPTLAPPRRPRVAEPAAQTAADNADQESFIYTVSHDLRAPIRVVEGFARILKEDYGRFLDRIGNDHTDRILAAAARMNSMIDSLLALSRLQSQPIKRQPVDLSQLARYVLEDLRSNEPEREADIHIEPGLVIQGDPTLMRIAIENLVGNAWKYSSQSATTRIELRRETARRRAHLRRSPTPAPASTCASPTACSACSSGCTARRISRARASGWPRCGASSAGMAGISGPSRKSARARGSTSRCLEGGGG